MKDIPTELKTLLEQYRSFRIRQLTTNEHWQFLQRMHVLSQPFWFEHMRIHFRMAYFAFRTRVLRETFFQLIFTLGAAPSSILRIYPIGHLGTFTAKNSGNFSNESLQKG